MPSAFPQDHFMSDVASNIKGVPAPLLRPDLMPPAGFVWSLRDLAVTVQSMTLREHLVSKMLEPEEIAIQQF